MTEDENDKKFENILIIQNILYKNTKFVKHPSIFMYLQSVSPLCVSPSLNPFRCSIDLEHRISGKRISTL